MEAAEADKREKTRAVKECRRKRKVEQCFAEIKERLDKLHVFQKEVLDSQHQRDREHFTLTSFVAMDCLDSKSTDKLDELQALSWTRVEEMQDDWELNKEEHAEEDEKRSADSTCGKAFLNRRNELVKKYKCDMDCRDDVHEALYDSASDGDVGPREPNFNQLRGILDEELTVEQRLIDAKKQRIRNSFERQERELQAKIHSELRWFALVTLERNKQLDERLATELRNEIVGEDDDRWDSFWVYEEFEEIDPSRYCSIAEYESG